MIQKYIKVVLSLLCLLNLGISGSSGSGLTTVNRRDVVGGGTMQVLLPINHGEYSSLIRVELPGGTVELSVCPLEWVQCEDEEERLVFNKTCVLDVLNENIKKAENISTPPSELYQEYGLSYGGHILGEEECFFNDSPLSLILPATCQLNIARLSDIAAGNTLKILFNDEIIEVPVNPYQSFPRLNQGELEQVLTFQPAMIVDKLVFEGRVVDPDLCRLFTWENPLITRALSAKGITEENINTILGFNPEPIDNSRPVYNTVKPSIIAYPLRLNSSVDEDSINLVFTMPNTTNYGNFSSATGQDEFGDTIMNRLLIALVEKYGELFLLQDGNKLKLFLDNGNLKVLKEGQEIPLELHSDWELCYSEGMSGLEIWLEIYMAVGVDRTTTYQLDLFYKQTCFKDQENLVHLKWHRYRLRNHYVINENVSLTYQDTSNGSDEVKWATVSPEIIQETLRSIVTELQSEAAANPVQSAASSSGLDFAPPARSPTPATSSAGLDFAPHARSLPSSGYPNP